MAIREQVMRLGRRRPDTVIEKAAQYQEPISDESVDALLDYLGSMALRMRRAHKLRSANADNSEFHALQLDRQPSVGPPEQATNQP
jgi:hypothetical protein